MDPHAEKAAIMQAFLDAINAGDADGMATAFEQAYDVCAMAKGGDDYGPPAAETGGNPLEAVFGKKA
jgi:hypothetical protein